VAASPPNGASTTAKPWCFIPSTFLGFFIILLFFNKKPRFHGWFSIFENTKTNQQKPTQKTNPEFVSRE
jgi:hypothetical protein